ncbi:MAG: hypothetical protein M9928_22675 [Anaerolineae bacterium]|nr:hypothetical protein [Anaerolineae bacterium]MCO5194857.1 hypothetical protein [Anaerolineae bacterium]MCO5207819.1 hypothetical protein [Anaerolineae bacterium]
MNLTIDNEYENILINAMRMLPPNRVELLVEFARFLEAQSLNETLLQDETEAAIEADNAQWDALLATDSAQNMLKQLIAEASAEYSAGKTRPISFDDERITPG